MVEVVVVVVVVGGGGGGSELRVGSEGAVEAVGGGRYLDTYFKA